MHRKDRIAKSVKVMHNGDLETPGSPNDNEIGATYDLQSRLSEKQQNALSALCFDFAKIPWTDNARFKPRVRYTLRA